MKCFCCFTDTYTLCQNNLIVMGCIFFISNLIAGYFLWTRRRLRKSVPESDGISRTLMIVVIIIWQINCTLYFTLQYTPLYNKNSTHCASSIVNNVPILIEFFYVYYCSAMMIKMGVTLKYKGINCSKQ